MAVTIGTNAGFVTAAPTADPESVSTAQADNGSRASKFTSPSTAVKITEIGWWTGDATEAANFQVGVYTHDSGGDKPNVLVGSSGDIAKGTGSGWKVGTGLNITISPSTVYWLAWELDDTATFTSTDTGGTGSARRVNATNNTSLVDPWGTSTFSDNTTVYAIYAVWEAAASVSVINIGDTWKEIDWANSQINIGDTWKAISAVQINIGDTWKTVYGTP